MVKAIAKDFIGEAIETGRAVKKQAQQVSPGQIAKKAVEQTTGASQDSIPPGLEDLQGKKSTPAQIQQMKNQDRQKKSQALSQTRVDLNRLKIRRYQQMQQEIVKAGQEKEQQQLRKEQEELKAREEKAQQEEQKQEGAAPKRSKPKGFFSVFKKQKKGTKELGKLKIG
jgi:hypothetical protein